MLEGDELSTAETSSSSWWSPSVNSSGHRNRNRNRIERTPHRLLPTTRKPTGTRDRGYLVRLDREGNRNRGRSIRYFTTGDRKRNLNGGRSSGILPPRLPTSP